MLRPRVELNSVGDMVHLVCDQNGGHAHEMDADEAWDLGDDLMYAGLQVLEGRGDLQWKQSEPPEWMQAEVTHSVGLLDLRCPKGGCIWRLHYTPPVRTLQELMDAVRGHWISVHSNVAEDAEGEDEDGHGEPAQADAAGEVAGGQDGEDRRDDVKQDGQHGA